MNKMVSVIIPTYNSEKTIGYCLEALSKQSYPKDKYEVIVVDDGSTDESECVVKKFKSVKFIKQRHGGPAKARNQGAKVSSSEILLFTDADCVPDKDWIKNMIEPFKDERVVGVSGTYKTLNENKLMARFIGLDIAFRHEKMKKMDSIDFVGTFSAGYKKSAFIEEGGFDTSFPIASGEDPDLSYRVAKKYKIVFSQSAFVRHPHPDSLIKYLKQKFWRAYWRALMYKKHKNKMLGDSYTPTESLFSIYFQAISIGIFGLLVMLSLFFSIDVRLIGVFILATTVLPNIRFSLWAWKIDKTVSLASPFIFFMRNVAFALGSASGSLKIFVLNHLYTSKGDS